MKLLKVLNGTPDSVPPAWIMRQAGRYLPEYRALRQKAPSFMEFCFKPELTIEATLQPLRRFDLDAAIIFSDILVIPQALGQEVNFVSGEGPLLDPVDSGEKLKKLASKCDLEVLEPVFEAIKGVKASLSDVTPLLGFAGGPWTVLTYMIEGRGSKGKGHLKTLHFSLQAPTLFKVLLDRVVEATIEYLSCQIEAGADALKIFESWASSVPASRREDLLYEPLSRITGGLKRKYPNTPLILFPKGLPSQALEELRKRIKIDAIAYDASLSPSVILDQSREVVQAGPDTSFLLSGGRPLRDEVRRYKKTFEETPYIFNLAHGIVPEAPIEHVHEMLSYLRES